MAKKKKAKKKKAKTRKIDMAEHDYKVKAMGLSDRATRLMLRLAILAIPVILIVFWLTKVMR